MAGSPHTKVTGTIATINVSHFTKSLELCLVRQQKLAIGEWARAVIARIPTYTGTAKGVFAPLNRVVRGLNIQSSSPVSKRAKEKIAEGTTIRGKHYKLGFARGKDYSEHDVSHVVTSNEQMYIFEFDISLPYVLWNDMYPAPAWITLPSNPPWHALDAGAKAFRMFVVTKIPQAIKRECKSIKVGRIKYG